MTEEQKQLLISAATEIISSVEMEEPVEEQEKILRNALKNLGGTRVHLNGDSDNL